MLIKVSEPKRGQFYLVSGDPDFGRGDFILYDFREEQQKSWGRQVGYVPQGSMVFFVGKVDYLQTPDDHWYHIGYQDMFGIIANAAFHELNDEATGTAV